MNSRSSLFVLAIGFSILIVLIAFLGFGAIRRVDAIYRDMRAAQDAYVQMETFRRGIATDVYLADILLRDLSARSVSPKCSPSPPAIACYSGVLAKALRRTLKAGPGER